MRKLVLLGTLLVARGASSAALQINGQAKAMASDKAEIAALEKRYNDVFNAKDVNAIMACYAPGRSLFVFDGVPPSEYPSWEACEKD